MGTLSSRLKSFRLAKEFTVTYVAEKLGVSVSTYREWESGRKIVGEPYQRLAEIFGVSLSELLIGKGRVDLLGHLDQIESHLRELRKTL